MLKTIALENVGRTYAAGGEPFRALSDVSLTFKRGERAAILGKSGSGKSTLLNMLTGIDRPTEGSVIADGARLETLDETALARWRGRNVGIVFQFYQLVPTLTLRENMLLAMEFAHVVPRGAREEQTRQLMQVLGVDRHADKLPSEMSGGEQQRAAIARSLANDPSLIVADEPTGNLDSRTAATVQEFLRKVAADGKTVIVVTHDEAAAKDYPRVIRLQDGRVASDTADPGVRGQAMEVEA